MNTLTVGNLSDATVAELARRAAERGVVVEEEARLILESGLPKVVKPAENKDLSGWPALEGRYASDEDDWIFDRHDLRNGQLLLPPEEDFKAHLLALGEIGADICLDWPRDEESHRKVEF